MERIFQQTYHIPGTLAANISPRFTAPCDCSLLHISAVASNDSDATLKIGTSADDDTYLAACTIGDSGTPVEKVLASYIGGQYPHIAKGTVVVLTLDYDGSAGTAAQNVTIVLTYSEG
jgi:hypothetical protein